MVSLFWFTLARPGRRTVARVSTLTGDFSFPITMVCCNLGLLFSLTIFCSLFAGTTSVSVTSTPHLYPLFAVPWATTASSPEKIQTYLTEQIFYTQTWVSVFVLLLVCLACSEQFQKPCTTKPAMSHKVGGVHLVQTLVNYLPPSLHFSISFL